ncbi:MAG: T9SS type A sorting domain-containing protein, partial [bacterium]
TKELFVGGVGPVGHGSCYALDYVSDTTWRVMWTDSSLRSSPLSVSAGVLDGQQVVAGTNTWDLSPVDTFYSQMHVYQPSGEKFGVWQRDTASVQNVHLVDIDLDLKTNIIAALIMGEGKNHCGIYEYFGTTDMRESAPILNEDFLLFPNYPNPFNPSTTLEFVLPERSIVNAIVYDILGKEVIKLLEDELPSGTHTIQWNGLNADGNYAVSGVYFFRLRTSSSNGLVKIAVRKMLFLH